MHPTDTARRPGATQAITLLLPATLAVMASAALAPGLPQLQRAFADEPGATWLVPMILTIPALCLVVFSPLAGTLGDRYGRRRMLIAGLIVYAMIGMAPLMLDSLTAILVSRVGVGIAEAFALTLSTTMVSDYFSGRERDKWLGYQTAVASISAIIFVGMAGFLGTFGWRAPFAIYGMPLIFAVLVWWLTWEPDRAVSNVRKAAVVAFPWKPMITICAITAFASISFYVAQIQTGVALAATGLRVPAQIGMFIAAASLGTVIGTIIFRFVSDRPTPVLLVVSFVLLAIGYAGVGTATTPLSVAAAVTIAQLGCGLVLPTLITAAIRSLPPEARGKGTGMWQGTFSIGQFLSPIAVTALSLQFGGILSAFSAFAVLNGVAALLALAYVLAARQIIPVVAR
jgi:MFS family permease